MPYLTFGTQSSIGERKEMYTRLEEQYQDKILHGSRTLDQFYYYSLPNTDYRDATQVVTKYIEERNESEKELKTILKVDQLWLWVIDESTFSAYHNLTI